MPRLPNAPRTVADQVRLCRYHGANAGDIPDDEDMTTFIVLNSRPEDKHLVRPTHVPLSRTMMTCVKIT
eukprot:2553331-Alexandrium_andersonii.AAC.1